MTIEQMIKKINRFSDELQTIKHVKVQINTDKKNMIDRQCAKENCKLLFKVNSDDLTNLFTDDNIFCPQCGNYTAAKEYLTDSQRNEVINNVKQSVLNHWKYNTPIVSNLSAIHSSDEFEINVTCGRCKVQFSTIGIAYFCPNCGDKLIELVAEESIEKIRLQASKYNNLKKMLGEIISKDDVETISKSILENLLCNCISILQNFSERIYNKLSNSEAPFNVFQNVLKSNQIWKNLKGVNYENWLTKTEVIELIKYTQQRHLIQHTGGIVDVKYLQSTNDKEYVKGNRIVVSSNDILKLTNIISKALDGIKSLS